MLKKFENPNEQTDEVGVYDNWSGEFSLGYLNSNSLPAIMTDDRRTNLFIQKLRLELRL